MATNLLAIDAHTKLMNENHTSYRLSSSLINSFKCACVVCLFLKNKFLDGLIASIAFHFFPHYTFCENDGFLLLLWMFQALLFRTRM